MHLVDYKVRILDGDAATAARTRVVIQSSGPAGVWSTVGSHTNIIAASVAALTDSLEYGLWKANARPAPRERRTTERGAAGTRPFLRHGADSVPSEEVA
jgi:hypothetical protein